MRKGCGGIEGGSKDAGKRGGKEFVVPSERSESRDLNKLMNKKTHTIELRVRYAETDQMGVVYYANHLVWFEIARTEFFRARGIEYRKMEKEDKIYLPVVESYCRYRTPLRYDDLVTVTAELKETGRTRLIFEYKIKKGEKLAATGSTKHAFVNEAGEPIPVPDRVRAALGKQEARM